MPTSFIKSHRTNAKSWNQFQLHKRKSYKLLSHKYIVTQTIQALEWYWIHFCTVVLRKNFAVFQNIFYTFVQFINPKHQYLLLYLPHIHTDSHQVLWGFRYYLWEIVAEFKGFRKYHASFIGSQKCHELTIQYTQYTDE